VSRGTAVIPGRISANPESRSLRAYDLEIPDQFAGAD